MPFSDTPPPFVLPKCKAGEEYRIDKVKDEVEVVFCTEFAEAKTPVYNDADLYRPTSLPQCDNRTAAGDRRHSWCFRCPSGFMFARLHVHDSQREDMRLAPAHV